jgi:hypothetical protein
MNVDEGKEGSQKDWKNGNGKMKRREKKEQ